MHGSFFLFQVFWVANPNEICYNIDIEEKTLLFGCQTTKSDTNFFIIIQESFLRFIKIEKGDEK